MKDFMEEHINRMNSLTGTRRGLPAGDPEAGRNTSASSHHYPGESVMKFLKLRFSTWNIGTLTGKSAELARVMQKRRIDILGLQETKWKGQKSKMLPHGYKLLYNGSSNKRNGVAIIVSPFFANKIINITRLNDRIIMVKVALPNHGIWNFVSAYGPQTGCTVEEKNEFWLSFEGLMENIPVSEKKIILADLNGHVGEKNLFNTPVHGGFGYGEMNTQGKDVLDFATSHQLAIVNTFFTKQRRHLVTYSSDRHNTQIDYILCDLELRKQFCDCKVILGESAATQHRLLVGEINIMKTFKRKDTSVIIPKIRWHKLKDETSTGFIQSMQEYLTERNEDSLESSPNQMWKEFQRECTSLAKSTFGVSKGALKDDRESWFWNSSVENAVSNKKKCFKNWKLAESDATKTDEEVAQLKSLYKKAKKESKRAVAKSIQESSQNFYEELDTHEGEKTIYRIAAARQKKAKDIINAKYVRDIHGTILTDDAEIKRRWKEFYETLYNEEFPRLPRQCRDPVYGPVPEISVTQVKNAISKMKNRKSTGPDEIPAEFWKIIGEIGAEWLMKLFNKILNGQEMPEDFRECYLLPFYKHKGDASECNNYRGIVLASHTLKILEDILDTIFKQTVEISDHQCGFVSGKSTMDAIQTLRIVIEKSRDNKQDLHLAFIDLEKAFDRIPRSLVWDTLRAQDIPEAYVRVIMDMYEGRKTCIKCTVGLSEFFSVGVGVSQGSKLSPRLFILVLDYLTAHLMNNSQWSLIFADDIVLVANTREKLEEDLENWRECLENNGLRISRKKTEYMHLHFSESFMPRPVNTIYLDSEPLNCVESFTYLGSVISKDGKCDEAVQQRIQSGWLKWRSLTGVLCDKRFPVKLKGRIYNTMVKPVLLYGSETWTRMKVHDKRMQVTENKMLRWSGGVTLLDKVPNKYLHGSLGIGEDIQAKMNERQLRWYGHTMRRDEDHMTRKALAIPENRRQPGRPKETWWNNARKRAQEVNLDANSAENRIRWNLRSRAQNFATPAEN